MISGIGVWPKRSASAAHRSRHSGGVAGGTSRWLAASQTCAHARGTTR